jgi:tetratricopeptide (TPR) repeat protein
MMNAISILSIFFVLSTSVFSMGTPPDKKDANNANKKQTSILNVLKRKKDKTAVVKEEHVVEIIDVAPIELSDEEIYELEENREKYEKFRRKNFSKAKDYLNEIPESHLTDEETDTLEKLVIFEQVIEDQKIWEAQFGKQETGDPYTTNQVNRLYKAAQVSILDNEYSLASDYLSQATFLDPKDQRVKSLGELVLGEKPKRVNVEAKYHELSIKNIYTGNFEEAAKELEILSKFTPDNPIIYERMGTAYYLDWNIDKAVQSWKSALYYNSENKELLERWIENAEKYKEEQHREIKSLIAKKKTDKSDITNDDNYFVTVLFTNSDQAKATSYAQEAGAYLKNKEKIEVRENFDTGDFQVVKLVPKPPEQ